MNQRFRQLCLAAALAGASAFSATALAEDRAPLPNMMPFPNPSGFSATYSVNGDIDFTNPFFKVFGTNGRSCETCHQSNDGWTITPDKVRARFVATQGTDPLFRTNDGSNSPRADVSTVEARVAAYNMLLDKALIRVGIGIPEGAEFDLAAVDDPYGYASAKELSLFRRPLPAANLAFLSTVMWDGRETFKDAGSLDCILGTSNCFAPLHFNLADQANGATTGHAQATQPLSAADQDAIATFETGLYTAQVFDKDAGSLEALHALGGPANLSRQTFYFGINDAVSGDYRTGALFNPNVFALYDAWDASLKAGYIDRAVKRQQEARRSVVRGQELFNTKPISITGVGGLNDDLGVPVMQGTCSTCHDTPGAGNHSVPVPLNIGIADGSRRTPDMPLYTLLNKATGETVQTTDPGRALITGKWKDIGKFKGPVLRALAARAPYFHNGMAPDLAAVVDFYDTRFNLGLTGREKHDLIAFLRTL